MEAASQVATHKVRIFDTNPARTNSADLVEGFRQLLDINKSVVVRGDSPFNEFALDFLCRIDAPKVVLPPSDAITAVEKNELAPNVLMSMVTAYFDGIRNLHPGLPMITLTVEREKAVVYLTARPDETNGVVSTIIANGSSYYLLNGVPIGVKS